MSEKDEQPPPELELSPTEKLPSSHKPRTDSPRIYSIHEARQNAKNMKVDSTAVVLYLVAAAFAVAAYFTTSWFTYADQTTTSNYGLNGVQISTVNTTEYFTYSQLIDEESYFSDISRASEIALILYGIGTLFFIIQFFIMMKRACSQPTDKDTGGIGSIAALIYIIATAVFGGLFYDTFYTQDNGSLPDPGISIFLPIISAVIMILGSSYGKARRFYASR